MSVILRREGHACVVCDNIKPVYVMFNCTIFMLIETGRENGEFEYLSLYVCVCVCVCVSLCICVWVGVMVGE